MSGLMHKQKTIQGTGHLGDIIYHALKAVNVAFKQRIKEHLKRVDYDLFFRKKECGNTI